jgi:glycosyl transferase family 2
MRLFAATMVRNEADVVEAFVRHNLRFLDGIVIIDHASEDGTAAILAALQREGLPLRVFRDTSLEFFQAERMTALTRETLARERCDFVFAMDTDEFIKCASRAVMEDALAAIPAQAHGALHWLTYVPESFDDVFRLPDLRRRRRTERHHSYKSVVGRSFVERRRQYLVSGNHLVDDLEAPTPPPRHVFPPEVVALAHYPVRSRGQLERKIVLGYLSHLATRPDNDRQAAHWRELFARLRDGAQLDATELADIAFNYGLPANDWRPADPADLVEDPITLTLLMRFTEMLFRQSAQR